MRQFLEKILPDNDLARKYLAIGLTVLLAGLLTYWGIYDVGSYGLALFLLTPFFIGTSSSMIYGLKKGITVGEAWNVALLSLLVFTLGLLIFAMEGLLCIIMVAPIGVIFTWLGSVLGYAIVRRAEAKAPTAMLILLCSIPLVAFVEKDYKAELRAVVSSIEIDAAPQTVWKNVVEFPQLEEPTEFIFKTGIAYPINAKIEGTGVGAIRHCNFTTGSFVEPITVWDEPRLLKFDVLDQPEPMKEISFWDINAPHLHDYFVSKQGQFKLTALPNGKTLLEGTTWYHHRIKPAFYWQLWSDQIVHAIHQRVLEHIKKNSEQQ